MSKLLLVGKNSFIGQHVIEVAKGHSNVMAISHREIDTVDLDDYDCIVNLSYQPRYFDTEYDESIDFAVQLARKLAGKRPHYVIVCTRRVYGTRSHFPVSEEAPLDPSGYYGRNCVVTESKVKEILGDRCTVVRGANVFGHEPNRHTFFGLAMTYLHRDNKLSFNFSPFTKRDFIPVEHFSKLLWQVAEAMPGGIYNIGSGRALPVGQIALWLLEGFGRGEVHITGWQEFDAFQLDIRKLEGLLGPQPDLTEQIRANTIAIGRKYREARLD